MNSSSQLSGRALLLAVMAWLGLMAPSVAVPLPILFPPPLIHFGQHYFKPTYGGPPARVTNEVPPEPPGSYYQGDVFSVAPELAPLSEARVHQVHLDITHKIIEIRPGVKYLAWTFGNMVPGPIIHIRQGDTVDFSLTNRTGETASITDPMPHSIDFHAAMVAPSDKYRSIYPGQTIRFRWVANYPGVFMYHCGTPRVFYHLIAGMYGAVVVDPKGGWPDEVDRQYVLIQSEFYTKSDGVHPYLVPDLDQAFKRQPTYVAFDGEVGKLVKHPLIAKAGERVRLYVLNVGPTDPASFHVIGTLMDKVYLDGNPANELRGMQTVLLGVSSGAVCEFVVPEAGMYTFVDHDFAFASLGALGKIDAR